VEDNSRRPKGCQEVNLNIAYHCEKTLNRETDVFDTSTYAAQYVSDDCLTPMSAMQPSATGHSPAPVSVQCAVQHGV
jgi:hypothetical protein